MLAADLAFRDSVAAAMSQFEEAIRWTTLIAKGQLGLLLTPWTKYRCLGLVSLSANYPAIYGRLIT
jgi:hypothetical protein